MQALLFANNVNDAHHKMLRLVLQGAVIQGKGLGAAWDSWHLPILHARAMRSYESSSEQLLTGSPGEKPQNPTALAKALTGSAVRAAVLKNSEIGISTALYLGMAVMPSVWGHLDPRQCPATCVICTFQLCITPHSLNNRGMNLIWLSCSICPDKESPAHTRGQSAQGSVRADRTLSSPSNIFPPPPPPS